MNIFLPCKTKEYKLNLDVFYYYFDQGYSTTEVARILGVKKGTSLNAKERYNREIRKHKTSKEKEKENWFYCYKLQHKIPKCSCNFCEYYPCFKD